MCDLASYLDVMGVDRAHQAGAFRVIGLTATDEVVWHALLALPLLDPQSLSRKCGLDDGEISAALRRLRSHPAAL